MASGELLVAVKTQAFFTPKGDFLGDGFFWWFFGFYVFLAFDFPGFFFFCFFCLVRGEKKGSLAHGILVGN